MSITSSETKKILIKIISFFFLLTPFALLTGPFFTDLLLIIISLLFLYLSFSNKIFYYFNNNYFKLIITFCLLISLRSIYIQKFELSFITSFFYFRFLIFSLAVWYILENNKDVKRIFFYILLLVFLFLFIDSFYQFIFRKNIFGYDIYAIDRVSSVFGKELILGGVILRFSLISFPLLIYFYKNSIFFEFFFLLKTIILFLIVLIAGERSAIFLMSMQIILYIFFIKKLRVKFFLFFFLITLFLSIFIYFNKNVKERILNNTFYLFTEKEESKDFISNNTYTNEFIKKVQTKDINFFSRGHQSHFATAIKMFLEEPIFGVGVKMFRHLCADKKFYTEPMGCSTHPHNTYIQLLAETGIIGFLLFFIIFLYLTKYLFLESIRIIFKKNSIIEKEYQTSLIIAVFINLWPLVTTGNFFNNYLSFYYYLPVGFLLITFVKKIKHD